MWINSVKTLKLGTRNTTRTIEYKVSKKTILLIVNPESKRKNDERIKDHWKDYQPTTEERNKIMNEHRQYKQKLHKDGKI